MRLAGPGWEKEERNGLEPPLCIHLSVFVGFSFMLGPVPGSQHADTQEGFPVWGGDRTMGIQEAHTGLRLGHIREGFLEEGVEWH